MQDGKHQDSAQIAASSARVILRHQLSLKTNEAFPLKKTRHLNRSALCAEVAFQMWDREALAITEHVYCLYLNQANDPVGLAEIARGGISGCLADVRIILAHGLLCMAGAIVLFHNHPTGSLCPSSSDLEFTRTIKRAAEAMNMPLLDHLILAPSGKYYSMSDSFQI